MRKLCIILLAILPITLGWAEDRLKVSEKDARQAVVTKEDPRIRSWPGN